MALANGTICEVQSGGSDTACSGGFNPGNSNFAADGAVSSATGSSPVFSSASYTFVAGDVGHWLFLKSGTDSVPGWYKIASVSGGNATLDAAAGHAVLYTGMKPNTTAGCGSSSSLTSQTWGVTYCRTATARFSFTDMVIDGTTNTKFTSAGSPVGKNFVGNLIQVTGGTGFTTQWVEVVSTSGTTATCDKSLGTLGSTGGTGYLGGALASPGMAGGVQAGLLGSKIYVAAPATYALTTSSVNVSGGLVKMVTSSFSTSLENRLVGFGTVWGDLAARPVLQASGITSCTLVDAGNVTAVIDNIELDGNSQTGIIAYGSSLSGMMRSVVRNCKGNGFIVGTGSPRLSNFGNQFYNNSGTYEGTRGCLHSGTKPVASNGITFTDSVFYNSPTHGSNPNGFTSFYRNCLFHSNTSAGVSSPGNSSLFENCIFWGNGTYGIDFGGSGGELTRVVNCAFGGNTSGAYSAPGASELTDITTITGDPCVNAAGGDFSLNNTAGAGAACRAKGLGTAQSNFAYRDLGPAQHQDSGGGGSTVIVVEDD